MKVFNREFQNKILNIILLAYAFIALANVGIPVLKKDVSSLTPLGYTYFILILIALISFAFAKKINLNLKAFLVVLILIISGLAENYIADAYKGYLFLLMAFLISSLILKLLK